VKRMTRLKMLVVIMSFFCASCTSVKTDFIGDYIYEFEDSIYYYDSKSGKEACVLNRESESQGKDLYKIFRFPNISYSIRKLVCVETDNYSYSSFGDEYEKNQMQKLLMCDLGNNKREVLLESSPISGKLACPVFSKDGKKGYYLHGSEIKRLNLENGVIDVITTLDAYSNIDSDNFSGNLALSDNQEFLALHICKKSNYKHCVYTVGLTNGEKRLVYESKLNPTDIDSKGMDRECAKYLFGSLEYPMCGVKNTAFSRYYTFKEKIGGFFGKIWIGCYDREENKIYELKVLSRSLYTE